MPLMKKSEEMPSQNLLMLSISTKIISIMPDNSPRESKVKLKTPMHGSPGPTEDLLKSQEEPNNSKK